MLQTVVIVWHEETDHPRIYTRPFRDRDIGSMLFSLWVFALTHSMVTNQPL